MVHTFERVTGQKIPYEIAPRRAGDLPAVYASPDKSAELLGWKAQYNLEDMCRDTWAWQSKNPMGYGLSSLKPWLLRIAQNKCTDYYRAKAKQMELPIDELSESVAATSLYGRTVNSAVSETLDQLGDKEKQILYLYYFKDLPQDQIAARLHLPLGTVKSRLHYAKQRFKETYPYTGHRQEEESDEKNAEFLPDYTIKQLDQQPFPVRWEEVMGWFIVPRLGEKLTWAMYDWPSENAPSHDAGGHRPRAEVHGIEGVEIRSIENDPMDCNSAGGQKRVEPHPDRAADRYPLPPAGGEPHRGRGPAILHLPGRRCLPQ